jgi:hypothetical protein
MRFFFLDRKKKNVLDVFKPLLRYQEIDRIEELYLKKITEENPN